MTEDNFAKDEHKDFSQKITEIKNKVQKLANQYGNSLRFISGEQEAEYFNACADYWRYVIGVNVIPADTRNKRPTVEWRQYQNTPISKEQHESWKLQNAFKNGMAIIAGKVWHNAEKNNLFLILVDLDNQKAIDEFCTRNGVVTPLRELAKSFIVEQHGDQSDKAHIIFYATYPFLKKSSDVAALNSSDIPAIEVKGAGEHGLLFCTPSPHKNGHNYEIIEGGTLEPLANDKLESHINNICGNSGIVYLDDNHNGYRGNRQQVNIQDLFKDDTKIFEGHNRHEALLRVIESLLRRNEGILDKNQIQQLAHEWNLNHCVPPLDEKEEGKQWKDAVKFMQGYSKRRQLQEEARIHHGEPKAILNNVTIGRSKEDNKNTFYAQRVSNDECSAEAVLIDKIPKFLVANNRTGEISILDSIPLGKEGKIAKPFTAESYINKPYTFNSQLELNVIIEEARKLRLDHLYRMVKRIWKKYVDADDFHISICAADTIFTYFQDKAGMTHYLFFVGGPGSGKSNNLEVFHFLAYRNMTSAGITPATLYRFYGGREEGIGTICEDEANDLDANEDKMRFYKNGYTTGKPVIRNDDTEFGRNPQKFFTFGWKALAAERLPDSIIAKGFMDRTIPMRCTYGFPEYDITEVTNPMGEEQFMQLLQELEKTRNLLLIYRILHHDDKFNDIPLNIIGREKQLFKPILRIFNNTDTQKELEDVISNYINERRAANVDSQHAFIFRTVVKLIKEIGSHELTSKDIWGEVTTVPGEFLYRGNTKFESVDYGLLTQKLVTKICKEVLGAKPSRDNTKRKLVFDPKKLGRLNQLFNLSLVLKVTHVTDVTHSGLTKYVKWAEDKKENEYIDTKNNDNYNIGNENNQNIINTNDKDTKEHSGKASHVSPPSPVCPTSESKPRPNELLPLWIY